MRVIFDPDVPEIPVNLYFMERLLAGRIRIGLAAEGRTAYLDLHFPARYLARIHEIFRFGLSIGKTPKVFIFEKESRAFVAIVLEFRTTWLRARSLIPKSKRDQSANLPDREVSLHFFSESAIIGDVQEFRRLFREMEYFIFTLMEKRVPQTMIVLGHYEEGKPPDVVYDWGGPE